MAAASRKFVHTTTGAVLTINGPRAIAGKHRITIHVVTASGCTTSLLWEKKITKTSGQEAWKFFNEYHPKPPQCYREVKARRKRSEASLDENPLVIPDSGQSPQKPPVDPGQKVKREYDL